MQTLEQALTQIRMFLESLDYLEMSRFIEFYEKWFECEIPVCELDAPVNFIMGSDPIACYGGLIHCVNTFFKTEFSR